MESAAITCDVCGETEFNVTEGFYFCAECGTQSQHVRDLEVDQAAIEESQAFFTSLKITKEKKSKDELTSWECFNYFLRSLVDELLKLGAKEALKLTVLQLWTTYLRKLEVAFFCINNVALPRLGPKFNERDARILYNHKKMKEARKRKSNETSGRNSLLIKKKRYAKAEYDTLSQSQQSFSSSAQGASDNSWSSLASNQAIKLNFSRDARNYYKRFMPTRHLEKHAMDSTLQMRCHNLQGSKFSGGNVGVELMTRKTLFGIVCLALNLIEDDLQLCDILRFCREGHLSTKKLVCAFPTEEIAKNCMDVLKSRKHCGWAEFQSRTIRLSMAALARHIHIPELKTPNLVTLAKRFITDLRLPAEIGTCVERLYNLNPSKMKFNFYSTARTPCYEGRAIAFVLFVLKLLFILDGETELQISNSSKAINAELKRLGLEDKRIFVWEEWVEYIEMRKVILSQCHYPTGTHLAENKDYDALVDDIKQTYETPYEDVLKSKRSILLTMEKIFTDLHKKLLADRPQEKIPSATFPPTLLPYSSYFQSILSDTAYTNKLCIPELMRRDPADADIHPFIHGKQLKRLFRENNVKLIVKKVGCKNARQNIGVYKTFPYKLNRQIGNGKGQFCVVDYNIDVNDWVENLKADRSRPDVFSEKRKIFKVPSQPIPKVLPKMDLRELMLNRKSNASRNTLSMHSFDIFSEDNMEPLPDDVVGKKPRQFDTESVLTNLTDDEDEEPGETNENNTFDRTVELKVSNFDCWNLCGLSVNMTTSDIQKIEKHLPPIFRWLLKTCAEVVEMEAFDLYEELLVIENQFMYALEPLSGFQDTLSYRKLTPKGQLYRTIDTLKKLW